MKQWTAIIMLMCVSYQYMIKLGIMAWYQVNKEYVATVLCENKEKPQMNCCGKCYLNKQLNKVDNPKEDTKQLPGKNQKTELSEFIPVAFTEVNIAVFENKITPHYQYQQFAGYNPLVSVFHPPSIC